MRIVWIGGSHIRHLYCMNIVHDAFPISAAIIEHREEMIPQPPGNTLKGDRYNFIKHFDNRARAEQKYFKKQPLPNCPILETDTNDLNSLKNAEFVRHIKPDVVIVFGCHLIKGPLFESVPYHTINLHLGLSPRYRGSATLFWPFYFMEPTYAGSTIHYIVNEPDAGNVIHQVTPKLHINDGIHDVACKTVIQSMKDMVELLQIFDYNKQWTQYKQRGTGKNFLTSDFKPEHLRIIYNTFNDDMVTQYLNGDLRSKKPKLIRQF